MKLRNKEFDEIFEIIAFDYINSVEPNGNGDYPLEYIFMEGIDESGDNYEFKYKGLKDLNAVWEDYNPAEPLIKDEKIRNAVRAWAEALKLVNCRYDAYWKAFRFCDQTISFLGLCDFDLEDGRIYDIAELCGEEEE